MPFDFASAAREIGFDLDGNAVRRFQAYRDRLVEESQAFNLTAVRDPEAIEIRHFLESLALGRLLVDRGYLQSDDRILDLGTGAGFPGLPLQIAFPTTRVALLESLTKRCEFLRRVVDELRLLQTTVLDGRAEDLGRAPALREGFDLVVARAVAPLPVLLEYALPFVKPGGYFAAAKGSATFRELDESRRALDELSGEHVETLALEPPEGMRQSVVIVRKAAATSDRYPRRPGIPSKRPIA